MEKLGLNFSRFNVKFADLVEFDRITLYAQYKGREVRVWKKIDKEMCEISLITNSPDDYLKDFSKEYVQETIKFLESISNNVGEIITEYHWREACALIKCLKEDILPLTN